MKTKEYKLSKDDLVNYLVNIYDEPFDIIVQDIKKASDDKWIIFIQSKDYDNVSAIDLKPNNPACNALLKQKSACFVDHISIELSLKDLKLRRIKALSVKTLDYSNIELKDFDIEEWANKSTSIFKAKLEEAKLFLYTRRGENYTMEINNV